MALQTTQLEAEPAPLDVDLSRCAVVIVDMQNAFVSQGGMFDLRGFDVSAGRGIVPTIRNITAAARGKGMKIFYVAHVLSPDLREVGPESTFWYKSVALYRENPQWADRFLIRGTWGAEIVSELTPEAGDIVVEKPRFSAFYGTNFDQILKTHGLKYLFFTGCATNICVEAAIRDAANLGYFPILVSDACANNGPPFMQQAAQFNVKLCFGWVTDTSEILKVLG